MKIKTYPSDGNLQDADKVIGTDSADDGTKNYTIGSISEYIRAQIGDPEIVTLQIVTQNGSTTNVDMTVAGLTVSNGSDVSLLGGNLDLSSGNITLANGNISTSNGSISATTGISTTSGDISTSGGIVSATTGISTDSGNISTGDGSISVRGDGNGLSVLRSNGNLAGQVKESDENQYGFAVGGVDLEGNLTNLGVFGSNIYIGNQNVYIGASTAAPYGYLKLGGTPVSDGNGNQFYPIGFQQIEQELYSEQATSNSDVELTDSFQTIVSMVLESGFSPPSTFEWSFVLEEGSAFSTEVEYRVTVDGLPSGLVNTTVGGNTTVTVTSQIETSTTVNAGQTIALEARVLDTLFRNTEIKGTESPSLIKLRQLGFGVFASDTVSVLSVASTIQPTVWGAFVQLDTSGGSQSQQLPSAANHERKTYTIIKTSSDSNTYTISPASGEQINSLTHPNGVVLSNQWDSFTLYSNGTQWLLLNGYGGTTGVGAVDIQIISVDSNVNPAVVNTLYAVDASSGDITITLPASPVDNDIVKISKRDSSTNSVIIDGNGNNIDGQSSQFTDDQYTTTGFQYSSDLGEWVIIG